MAVAWSDLGEDEKTALRRMNRGPYPGLAPELVDVLAAPAEARGWSRLVLNAPRQPEDGRRLYEQMGSPADWTVHVIRFETR